MVDTHLKSEILAALRHPEAQDGLYFRNFIYLHEEDERPAVHGTQEDVLTALGELVSAGLISVDESAEDPIFMLIGYSHSDQV